MFGNKKIESLTALKGVDAANITAEQIAAVNTELADLGISGIEVSIAGALTKASTDLSTANADLNKVKEDLQKAQDDLVEANSTIESLNAQLAENAADRDDLEINKDNDLDQGEQDDIFGNKMAQDIREKYGI